MIQSVFEKFDADSDAIVSFEDFTTTFYGEERKQLAFQKLLQLVIRKIRALDLNVTNGNNVISTLVDFSKFIQELAEDTENKVSSSQIQLLYLELNPRNLPNFTVEKLYREIKIK